ncbi:hypothetical protein GCM10009738_61540 [Kitasatospora viridis]
MGRPRAVRGIPAQRRESNKGRGGARGRTTDRAQDFTDGAIRVVIPAFFGHRVTVGPVGSVRTVFRYAGYFGIVGIYFLGEIYNMRALSGKL